MACKVIWNRRYYDENDKMHWRDPAEWIVHENAHPAILTEEQWKEINKRITRRMPKGGERRAKYRLSGLMKCGYCGAGMVSRRYSSKGPHKNRFIFVCSNYQKSGGCQFTYIFVDEADEQVFNVIESMVRGKINFGKEEMQRAVESQEKEFKRREKIIDQKFQRQIQAYENGLISERDLRIVLPGIESKPKENCLRNRKKGLLILTLSK